MICNSNSSHSFIFKLCPIIVHTWKKCTSYFVHILLIFSYFLRVLNLDIFSSDMQRGVRFVQSVIQTDFIPFSHIEDVHLLFYAHFTNIFFIFGGFELRHFFVRNAKMVSGWCNL